MKLYITGPVGSGKSTLARRLTARFGVSHCELDGVVYGPDNRKRSEEERDALFYAVIDQENWIVEDTGRRVFEEARRRADAIVLLEPPVSVRIGRILTRWVKQNLGMEECGYVPDLTMLKLMFHWTRDYQRGIDGLRERLIPYGTRVVILKKEKDIARYIDALEGSLCGRKP